MAIDAVDEIWTMSAEYDVAKAIYISRRHPTFSEICEMFDNAELYPLLTRNQVSAALDTLMDCGIVKSQWGKGKRKKARVHTIARQSRETLRTLIFGKTLRKN